ncbi:MAG: peptide ABC transporter substrate-binding protein [Treponema sp.]|nr:peptide ABC transporter substrate-binding protein [Treponema sp.]
MKKLLTLLVSVLILLAMFSACNRDAQPRAAVGADTQRLVFGMEAEPRGYDPGIGGETFALPVVRNVFYGPIKMGPDGGTVPSLATRWTISNDGLVYTFYLREDAKWSDGTNLTAQDYVYSYRRVVDPSFASPQASSMFPILNGQQVFTGQMPMESFGVTAISDYVLQITLHSPMLHFLQTMHGMAFLPVNQRYVETGEGWHRNASTYIGTGPFMVTNFDFGNAVTLVKNPHFYDADNVRLEELVFRIIPDMGTGVTAVATGEIDGHNQVPAAEVAQHRVHNPAFRSVTILSTTYWLVNTSKWPYNDPRIGRALTLAIDRETIIFDVLQNAHAFGYALAPPGLIVNGRDFREAGGDYGFGPNADVAEARRLLAEAGFPNGEGFPTMRLRYYTDENVRMTVEAIQQMWATNLNIRAEVDVADWQIFYTEVQNLEYDVAAMGSNLGYPHPTSMLNSFMTGNTGSVMTAFSNARYDDLMSRSWVASNEADAAALMHEAEDLLMSYMPTIPIFHQARAFLLQPYVRGFYRTGTNVKYFENAYIEGRGR